MIHLPPGCIQSLAILAVLLSASARALQGRIVALAMTELKEPGKNRFRLSMSPKIIQVLGRFERVLGSYDAQMRGEHAVMQRNT